MSKGGVQHSINGWNSHILSGYIFPHWSSIYSFHTHLFNFFLCVNDLVNCFCRWSHLIAHILPMMLRLWSSSYNWNHVDLEKLMSRPRWHGQWMVLMELEFRSMEFRSQYLCWKASFHWLSLLNAPLGDPLKVSGYLCSSFKMPAEIL